MPQLKQTDKTASFQVTATAGDARAGTLTINGQSLDTPTFFPVLSFYGGGTKSSVFGGGVHRTIKEFMLGKEEIGGGTYDKYFRGTMTSVASLTDYGINRERFDDYISDKIKERETFSDYNGLIFIDSGGYKFLHNDGLDGSDFEIDIDQREAFRIQKQLGGDIIVNLDRPISPSDTFDERQQKAERTAENAVEFARLTQTYPGARYLTVHGYNYSMLDRFFDHVQSQFGNIDISTLFDGIALGSLVPKKDDKAALITAVMDCVEIMDERGLADLPLHVLGIGSGSIPLLVAAGADTFDSTTYLLNAINEKYAVGLTEHIPLDEVDFTQCDCAVCSDPMLVDWMQGNTEYQKDVLGPVAMHNLIIHRQEVRELRKRIKQHGTEPLIDYLDETVGRNDSIRKQTHRVVNEALGGYF
ncbi:tRNA-guanine transglycosylase [Haloterrigena sp. SYSU A121-1]|uniref:tRNA-guanine transglycosylase n=1 Tax=Haloterrigena gelatinilytica TaxID=2741724 RepID=A0A8J8GJI6_9EURY|nr:tRNA-guanine transglycosylase [Haloterrigena gelatinilytica]NUB91144.1 tRNA-guanine transglycosylase [Haloterrigena gelatinilytica]